MRDAAKRQAARDRARSWRVQQEEAGQGRRSEDRRRRIAPAAPVGGGEGGGCCEVAIPATAAAATTPPAKAQLRMLMAESLPSFTIALLCDAGEIDAAPLAFCAQPA